MSVSSQSPMKEVQSAVPLDDIDRRLVQLLARDGRMSNAALAEECGIAPSTCIARMRNLREQGVITGFAAQISPAALGRPLEALVAIRLQPHARTRIPEFGRFLKGLPGVLNVFFLAGAIDFQVHVAAKDTSDLQDLIVHQLSANQDVAVTETNLIFEHQFAPLP